MSRFASFQQLSGMSALGPAILVGIGSRRATTGGWRHRRLLRGRTARGNLAFRDASHHDSHLNRRTMRACLLADFLGPGQKLRPTTGELPCRVSCRIAAWMAQMVVSIEVAHLLLSPPQYPPMHHQWTHRQRGERRMARPGWAPVATLFRDNPFFIRSPSSPLDELSFSAFSSPVCRQHIPAARRVVA